MDNVSRISMFVAVVKHQSFAGAARSLGLTGPALSKQVQTLEDQLGAKLLHRTTRHISLTEEGAIYFERASKALEDLAEAEQLLHDQQACPKGSLKINAPMSFGGRYLAQPIAAFASEYPDICLDIDFDDRNIDMIAEGYDVVVRIGALNDSSLIARKLAPCPILLCATPTYLKKHGTPKTPEMLEKIPAIIYTKHGNNTEWRFEQQGKQGNCTLKKHMGANNAEAMLQACLHGIGVALLPIFVAAPHLATGELVRVLPDYETSPERNIYAIFPKNRYLSTKTRLFVDWLTDFSKQLPW